MDKIFKNDKIMGIVAVATLLLVGYLAYKNFKSAETQTEETKEETTQD